MPHIVAGHLKERDPKAWTTRLRVALASGWSIAALAVVAAALVGTLALVVSPAAVTEETGSGVVPAVVEHPEGMSVARLRLTELAARRTGIETGAVRAHRGGDARLAVPYGALLYDADGKTWVYTAPQRLTYVRAPVVVDRIEGGSAFLSSGPEAGTRVVTVGAQELLGTEFEVDH